MARANKAKTQQTSKKTNVCPPQWPLAHKLLNAAVGIPATVIADAAGISAATVCNLRNGKVFSPRARTLEGMGQALGLHLMWVTTNVMRQQKDTEKECLQAVTPERLTLRDEAARRRQARGKREAGAKVISFRKEAARRKAS